MTRDLHPAPIEPVRDWDESANRDQLRTPNDQRLPCPMHVRTKDGVRFCEQGEAGHPGTHCGDRTEAEYRRLVEKSSIR